jgi:hypothetical protein
MMIIIMNQVGMVNSVVVGVSVRRKREGEKEKKSQEKKFVHT